MATVLDCFSKKVVGYAMAEHMRTELVTDALRMAARNLPFQRGETIIHTDRGVQYMSAEFASAARELGVRRSVGRTGVCWDNSWAESFNGTLKNERVTVPNTRHGNMPARISSPISSCGTTRFGFIPALTIGLRTR